MINITHHQGSANQNHMRYHLTLVRMAIFKKKCCQGCGNKGTLVQCWWECKLAQPQWKKAWRFLKNLKIELLYDPAIPLLGIYQKRMKTLIWKDIFTTFVAALFTTAQTWKQPVSINGWMDKENVLYKYNEALFSHTHTCKWIKSFHL